MILTVLEYIGIAVALAVVVAFIILVGAMLGAIMVKIAEGEYPVREEKKK